MREPISRARRRDERGSELPAPVVVVGAGWIGSRVAIELAASGVAVVAATRSGAWRGEGPRPTRVSLRALDLLRDDPADVAAALAVGRAAVACLAPGRDQERRSVYVDGARRFALSSAAASLARAVWCSSTSALPAADGDVDEDCDAWPLDERGRVQREAEEVFREGCRESGIPWVILRLAGLYGPGRDLERLYRRPPTRGGHIGASAGADESPLPGDSVASPIHVTGTANVFEATVSFEVRDHAGDVVMRGFTTATSGNGTRGTFETELAVPELAGPATIVAFEASAEDGSPLHVVQVPVTVDQ